MKPYNKPHNFFAFYNSDCIMMTPKAILELESTILLLPPCECCCIQTHLQVSLEPILTLHCQKTFMGECQMKFKLFIQIFKS